MAQQRIHDITLKTLKLLTESVNKERVKEGEKKLTVPDMVNEAVDFLYIEHLKAKKAATKKEVK